MSEYVATIRWQGQGARFVDNRYSRKHEWEFDGGVIVPASSSPQVVPLPHSDASAVDPEEAFVASLASCHMLTFLWVAARRGHRVLSYQDRAVGIMRKNAEGKLAITEVTLHPHIVVARGETALDDAVLEAMHHEAHEGCFVASSVKTAMSTQPTFALED